MEGTQAKNTSKSGEAMDPSAKAFCLLASLKNKRPIAIPRSR